LGNLAERPGTNYVSIDEAMHQTGGRRDWHAGVDSPVIRFRLSAGDQLQNGHVDDSVLGRVHSGGFEVQCRERPVKNEVFQLQIHRVPPIKGAAEHGPMSGPCSTALC